SSFRRASISAIGLLDSRLQRLDPRAHVLCVRLLVRPSVLQELAVMIEGAAGVAGGLVLAREVVVRGRIARVELERVSQVAQRVTALTGRILRQGKIDQGVAAARIEPQGLPRFGSGGIEAAQLEERRRKVHVRGDVTGLNGNDPLELARRLVEQALT